MTDEHDDEQPRLRAMYIGTVTDREDPDLLGRVRINIPGVIEPQTGWAFPIATLGGGSAQRGGFFVPEVGAEVAVFFKEGDVDAPFYLAGAWGIPDATGENEAPTPVPSSTKVRAPNIRCIETRYFRITFDDNEREGESGELLEIVDKESGDGITIDRNRDSGPGIVIHGSAAVFIESEGLVKIKGTQVQINDRIVLPEGKPI